MRPCGTRRYLHGGVHEASVAEVGQSTEARVLTLVTLLRVVVAVAVGVVGR